MKRILILITLIVAVSGAFAQDSKYRIGLSFGAMDIGAPGSQIKSTFGYEAHLLTEVNFTERCGLRVLPGIVQHGGRFNYPEIGMKDTKMVHDYINLQVLSKYRILHNEGDPDVILLAGVYGDYPTSAGSKLESGYTVQGLVAWKHVEVGFQYSNTLFQGAEFNRTWENMGIRLNFIL